MKPSQVLKNLLSQVFGQAELVKQESTANTQKNCPNCKELIIDGFCIHCDSHHGQHIQALVQELKNPKPVYKKKEQSVEQYLESLARQMHEAISIEDYERAAVLRDCISVTKNVHLEESGLKLALAKAIQEKNCEEINRIQAELQNLVEKSLKR